MLTLLVAAAIAAPLERIGAANRTVLATFGTNDKT